MCLNLKIFKANNHSLVLNEDKEFLPKFEYFEKINSGYNYYICANEINQLKIFSDKYYRTMKRLNVWFGSITKEEVKTCTECISRFENLRQLKFTINLQKTTEPIDNCLSLIGQKCNKLLKLHLSIKSSVTISDQFFDVFTQFKAIKKLKIHLWNHKVLSGSVECFKHCKQLYDLHISYPELKEYFFTDVQSFVPKLQILKILSPEKFSDTFSDLFDSMKTGMAKVGDSREGV